MTVATPQTDSNIAKTFALGGILVFMAILIAMVIPHNVVAIGYMCVASCGINALNAVSAKKRSTGLAGVFTAGSLVSLYGAATLLAPQIAMLFVH